MFRQAEDIPITSGKFNCITSFDDSKFISDHVYNKYVYNKETKEKQCKFYAYGCSLGACILHRQIEIEGKNTYFDAVSVYCTPWDILKGHRYFYDHAYGFYSWAIGLNLNRIWRKFKISSNFRSWINDSLYHSLFHSPPLAQLVAKRRARGDPTFW